MRSTSDFQLYSNICHLPFAICLRPCLFVLTLFSRCLDANAMLQRLHLNLSSQDPVQPGATGEGSGFKVGKRLVGGDLALPCHLPINCTNVWGRPLADGKRYETPFADIFGFRAITAALLFVSVRTW